MSGIRGEPKRMGKGGRHKIFLIEKPVEFLGALSPGCQNRGKGWHRPKSLLKNVTWLDGILVYV